MYVSCIAENHQDFILISTCTQEGGGGGGVFQISSDMGDQRIFLG